MALGRELRVPRVEGSEPAPDVLEAHPLAAGRGGLVIARVHDSNAELVRVARRIDLDRAAFDPRRDAVLDRVFDQGLQEERRDPTRLGLRIDPDAMLEPVAEPSLTEAPAA